MAPSPTVTLNDGVEIPQLGFGVYKVPADEAEAVVSTALEVGYRHIDTAKLYDNEEGVGRAVRSSGIPRDELFVTTKIWNDDHGYDEALAAFDASMARLGLDVLDLLLIHWPCPSQDRYVDTWRALERLQADGRVRSIGVSNFHVHHLHRLMAEAPVVPSINQVELHPLLPQDELRMFDAAHGIATEAWSPLARGALLDDPVIGAIAARIGRTPDPGRHRLAPRAGQRRDPQVGHTGAHRRELRRPRHRAHRGRRGEDHGARPHRAAAGGRPRRPRLNDGRAPLGSPRRIAAPVVAPTPSAGPGAAGRPSTLPG